MRVMKGLEKMGNAKGGREESSDGLNLVMG